MFGHSCLTGLPAKAAVLGSALFGLVHQAHLAEQRGARG